MVEPDRTYRLAASSVASGGVRQLFTRPENVQLSQYTHQVIAEWEEWASIRGPAATELAPALGWRANGYPFVAGRSSASSRQLETDYDLQQSLGVEVVWLEPEEIHQRFAHISVDDLGPGILSPRDGWLDPHAFLHGMRARAQHLGATFMTDRVVGFEVRGRRVETVRLASGGRLGGRYVVNVAGVWGPALSAQLGLRLPVEPMRRFDHYVQTRADFAAYPS